MINYNPLLCLDFYKTAHANQYPSGLTRIVSYYTPRMTRLNGIDKLPLFGLQAFIREYLIEAFNRNFFSCPFDDVYNEYCRVMQNTVFTSGIGFKRFMQLHKLGYLPLEIRAVPEGTRTDIRVPQIEISNTHPDFVWLVNTIETMLSCTMWHTQISAEIGYLYRQILNEYADRTCDDTVSRARLLGDFSMRGQESVESATKSSAAFMLSFLFTETVPAILWLEDNYLCRVEHDQIGFGSLSTEHSVMCSNFALDGDEETLLSRLLTQIYPDKNFSIVSDTYWNFVDNILPKMKNEILAHDGCFYIRGDSGDPVEVATKTVFHLWEIFGGTENSKGYKVLDRHVKAMYGDSITLQRCEQIYKTLSDAGFAIDNLLLGAGSFSLQCLETLSDGSSSFQPYTRDTFGIAVKATYAEDENGNPIMIFKDPKTDSEDFKRSQRGCCRVYRTTCGYAYEDGLTWAQAQKDNELQTVFKDGQMTKLFTLDQIRSNLHDGRF